MHGLFGTDSTQALLCGCTRPERANRFMLHMAEGESLHVTYSCVCDALPAPRHQSIAWCSLFSLSGGKGAH